MNYAPDNLERCCPDAAVRRERDVKQYIMNGYPAGEPIQIGESQYFCADCGRRLTLSPAQQD